MLCTARLSAYHLFNNLLGADTVIFLEFDWNPYADLQVSTLLLRPMVDSLDADLPSNSCNF